jgi:SAM-dependent methyltransferase
MRRGASVVAMDIDGPAVKTTQRTLYAMQLDGEDDGSTGGYVAVQGDLTRLPLPDGSIDRVICSETLEHVPEDRAAIAELVRVLRPGGRLAVSVPRALPERVCWALSREYHEVAGGHVRIYRASELVEAFARAGLHATGRHHAHALHSPYWWLRCALGDPEEARLSRWYQRVLEWDIMNAPTPLGRVERALDPLLGKSVVLYFDRPEPPRPSARTRERETAAAR